MKTFLYNALDWLIGKLWNPAGWVLIRAYYIKRWFMRRSIAERYRAAHRNAPPLTHAQRRRLQRKVEAAFRKETHT